MAEHVDLIPEDPASCQLRTGEAMRQPEAGLSESMPAILQVGSARQKGESHRARESARLVTVRFWPSKWLENNYLSREHGGRQSYLVNFDHAPGRRKCLSLLWPK